MKRLSISDDMNLGDMNFMDLMKTMGHIHAAIKDLPRKGE